MRPHLLGQCAMLGLLSLPMTAGADCTAGNPSASLPESTPTSAFIDNGNGTVTHLLTGLMWKKCPQGMGGAGCATGLREDGTWQEAVNFGVNDTTAGFTDWHLPNEKELESIVETCGYGPAINQTVFPGTPAGPFLSSTTSPANHSFAWAVDFQGGSISMAPKGLIYSVRLVRGGYALGAFDATRPLQTALDIDGNGKADALTDGLMILRYLFGIRGSALTQGALGPGAERTTSQAIEKQFKLLAP